MTEFTLYHRKVRINGIPHRVMRIVQENTGPRTTGPGDMVYREDHPFVRELLVTSDWTATLTSTEARKIIKWANTPIWDKVTCNWVTPYQDIEIL